LDPGVSALLEHSRTKVAWRIAAGDVSGYLVEELDLVRWPVG